MTKLDYIRKLDSSGRILIPVKLRDQYDLNEGMECEFYLEEKDGDTYICIKCPKVENEIEKAKRFLLEHGVTEL